LVEIESEIDFEEAKEVPEGPRPGDPEWQSYVLSQFLDTELFKGAPRVGGLRRVCEKVMGPIVGGKVVVFQSPCPANDYTAVVGYEIEVSCFGEYTRVFSSAADSSKQNTDALFRQYPTAIAETRAEARALRKALKIDVVSAEELSDVAELDKAVADMAQIHAIESLIKRKSLNKEEFAKKNKFVLENGEFVMSHDEAKTALRLLNKRS
jgi:hypothetical protein